MKKMSSGVDLVKLGLFGRLAKEFEVQYGQEKGDMFASAVTNKLFYEIASAPQFQEFSETHKEEIWNKIKDIMRNAELRYIISQALRVKANVYYASSAKLDSDFINQIEKLKEIGWEMPSDAPNPNGFLSDSEEFYNSTPK